MMTAGLSILRRPASEQNAEPAIVAVSSLLFAASTTMTIVWCGSMSAMSGMPMPGGWTMSMTWMRVPGQTWAGTVAALLGMWTVMMAAMMLPSLVPMLLRYREAVAGAAIEARLGLLTAWVGTGYFCLWTLVGMAALPLGLVLAEAEMRYPALSRAVPTALGATVLVAGAFQFTAWKTHHLACCREPTAYARGNPREPRREAADPGTAWRHGMRLGLDCFCSSAGLTLILLVMGVMDLRVMAAVTIAITAERLAPAGERAAHTIGVMAAGAGILLLVNAAGLH